MPFGNELARQRTQSKGRLALQQDCEITAAFPPRASNIGLVPKPCEMPVKLFYAATSPFVRKCLVAAQELGLRWQDWTVGRLDKVTCGLGEIERFAARDSMSSTRPPA